MAKENRLHPTEEQDQYVVEKNYLLKNPQLPSRLTKIKWEPWMVDEIKKCVDDILYFSESYFFIVSLDKGRIKIPLYDVQKRALKMMAENNRVVICSSRQMGKCLYCDSRIKIRFKPLGIAFVVKIGWFYRLMKFFSKLTLFPLDKKEPHHKYMHE